MKFVHVLTDDETLIVYEDGRIFTSTRKIRTTRNGRDFVITERSRELVPRIDRDGYMRVRFTSNGKRVIRAVHRLVATAFIPNPNNIPCVNHKDEVKSNNSVGNLEWCTIDYNNHYKNRYGRVRKMSKRVIMINSSGEVVMEFGSIKDAAEHVDGDPSNIGSCCNGRLKTAYGFAWRFNR